MVDRADDEAQYGYYMQSFNLVIEILMVDRDSQNQRSFSITYVSIS